MAGERVELSSHSGLHNGPPTSTKLLDLVHFNSAWILFLVFLVAFVTNSILTAEASEEVQGPVRLGPGGKPLPRSSARKNQEEREKKRKDKEFSRGRKHLFFYLSAALLATFVANGANIVAHALAETENGWWCGEATAVSGGHIHGSHKEC